MADINADVRETLEKTEAQILAGGIKEGQYWFASDTKTLWQRSVDGLSYEKVSDVKNGDSATFADITDTELAGTGQRPIAVDATGKLSLADALTYVDLDPTSGAPAYKDGRYFWDNDNNCPAFFNEYPGVINQVGREVWVDCKNNTASTITNGTAVYVTGIDTSYPVIVAADNTEKSTATGTIGFTTMDIIAGATGEVTLIGRVNGLDTSACVAGDIVYLGKLGAFTKTSPASPEYVVRLGTVGVISATVGTIECNVQHFGNRESLLRFYNGTFLQDHTVSAATVGLEVVVSLAVDTGTVLSPVFNSEFVNLDYTTPATVNLTQGTDVAPLMNYVYLDSADNVLKANTTGYPTDRQIGKVAKALCPTYTKVDLYGLNSLHAYTDHFADAVGSGHLQHINSWVRSQSATYKSGMLTQATGGAGVFDISVAVGVMLQLHQHETPAYDTALTSHIQVYNDSVTAYKVVTNLIDQLTDSAGVAMSGKSYSMFLWLVGSEDDGDSQLMCNLPSGSYNNSASAIADLNGYTNTTIPGQFRGVGIPLARVTVSHTSSGNTYTINEVEDLRGSGASGGGSVGATPPLTDVLAVGNTTATDIVHTDGVSTTTVSEAGISAVSGTSSATVDAVTSTVKVVGGGQERKLTPSGLTKVLTDTAPLTVSNDADVGDTDGSDTRLVSSFRNVRIEAPNGNTNIDNPTTTQTAAANATAGGLDTSTLMSYGGFGEHGLSSTATTPLTVEATTASDGLRVQRNGVTSQYMKFHESTGGEHVIEFFGNKPVVFKSDGTAVGMQFAVNSILIMEFLPTGIADFKNGATAQRTPAQLEAMGSKAMETTESVRLNGATASRPTTTIGRMYFDTTLGIPIWYNGTNWVDATGTIV